MAEKKSVKAFAVSTFGVSFKVEPSGTVAAGVDDAYAGDTYEHFAFRWFELMYLQFSAFFKTLRPFLRFLSAASLLALYSILFCSKFESFKYSSKDPTRDTGAYVKRGG
jgi:hypothetical protein